jgi:hypothetical protein
VDKWHRPKFRVFFAAIVGFALCTVSPPGTDEAAKAKEIQRAARVAI